MTRRRSRCTSWLLAGTTLVGPARGAVFVPPVLTPSTVQVGAAPRWVPICGRGRPIGSGSYDTTDSYVFDVSACTVPTGLNVRAVELVYSGSDMTNVGEMDRTVSMTGDAAVSLPTVAFTAVVNAATASGATSVPLQLAQGSAGNAVEIGMQLSGTGFPTGSMITGITPVVSSSNVTAVNVTFATSSGANSTTAAIASGTPITVIGRNVQATWGGARAVTVSPLRGFYTSDPMGVALPGGTQFFVRGSWNASATGFWLGDYPSPSSGSTRLSGEGSQRASSSIGDQTLTQNVASNSGGGYWSPTTVLGMVSQPTASVLIVGDSIAAGTGDAADSYGHMGYIERGLGQTVPWLSIARGSTSARQMAGDLMSVQRAAALGSGVTDVLLQYGRNDINASGNPQTAAATETYLSTIATPLLGAGYRVWVFTVPPTTDSADGWTSVAGQFLQQQASATTAATTAGSAGAAVTVSVGSSSGIQVGELAGLQNTSSTTIPTGTTVTAVPNATSVTLTPPSTGAIAAIPSGTTLGFGTRTVSASGTPIEYQRELFNTWCRTAAVSQGYAGCIDDDLLFEDPVNPGLWRSDLGAASPEGIHPSAALHNAAVAAGVVSPSLFPAR